MQNQDPNPSEAQVAVSSPALGAGQPFWQQSHLRFIADRNPFYLLSAVCLILGCWLLGHASQSLIGLAALMGALVVYEGLAGGMALWLFKQPGMGRDSGILSVLVLFLTCDFAFFYSQGATETLPFAAGASLVGAGLALALAGWLLRGFGVRLGAGACGLLAVDLLAIHLMPLAMRLLSEQVNMTGALLGVSVGSGLLVALHGLPAHWSRPSAAQVQPARLTRALAWLAPLVALASLLAHEASVQWVHEIKYGAVHVAPWVLGSATLLLGLEKKAIWPAGGAAKWAAGLAVLGLLLALGGDMGLVWSPLRGNSWLVLSPMRIACVWAGLVCLGAWRLHRRHGLLFAASCALGLAVLGHSVPVAANHVKDIWTWLGKSMSGSVPTTRTGWGVVLFVCAFVMLGVGALLSRWHARKPPVAGQEAGHD